MFKIWCTSSNYQRLMYLYLKPPTTGGRLQAKRPFRYNVSPGLYYRKDPRQ